MKTITFTNDLNKRVEMTSREFEKTVLETIQFAVNEKDYKLNDLTVNFIAEDVSGIIESFHNISHEMNDTGLAIIENILKELKEKEIKITVTRPITQEQLLVIKRELLLDEQEYCFDLSYTTDEIWSSIWPNETREQAYAKSEQWCATASYEDIVELYGDKYDYVLERYNAE